MALEARRDSGFSRPLLLPRKRRCPYHKIDEPVIEDGRLNCAEAWKQLRAEEDEAREYRATFQPEVAVERYQAWDNLASKSIVICEALEISKDYAPKVAGIVAGLLGQLPRDPNNMLNRDSLESYIWSSLLELAERELGDDLNMGLIWQRCQDGYNRFYKQYIKERRFSTAALGDAVELKEEVLTSSSSMVMHEPSGCDGEIIIKGSDGSFVKRRMPEEMPRYYPDVDVPGDDNSLDRFGFARAANTVRYSFDDRVVDKVTSQNLLSMLPERIKSITKKRSRMDHFKEAPISASDRKFLNRFVKGGEAQYRYDVGCRGQMMSVNEYRIRAYLAGGNPGSMDWDKPIRD